MTTARYLTVAACSLVALALGRSDARADDRSPRFVPTLGVEAGQYTEHMRVALGAQSQVETRNLTNTRLAIGVSYPLADDWLGLGELRAQTSVSVGVVYYVGHWPVQARQEAKLSYAPVAWLSLVGGLETGAQLNASRASHSYWELGLALGVVIADRVELLYLPAAVVALGSESEDVFGGSRRQKIDTGLQPVNFALRVHFEGLGW